jgi:hypothetical protein
MDNNYKIISQIDDNNIPHIISVLEDINDHYESHEILIDHRDDNFNSGNQLLRR